jgi:hypothetical protein
VVPLVNGHSFKATAKRQREDTQRENQKLEEKNAELRRELQGWKWYLAKHSGREKVAILAMTLRPPRRLGYSCQ